LKVNGRKVAYINDAKDRRQPFHVKKIAERYVQEQDVNAREQEEVTQ
jgi:hypothetical protein